ncbi:MAG TPA: hypothetical protein VGG35_16790 [Streptosporangiaceae bacterium]|jgi:hypothetical protein
MGDEQKQAERDARVALSYAEDCVRREEKAPRGDRTIADIIEEHAMELLDQLDGSIPRALMAARTACVEAATDVAHPSRWHTSMLAVELCRRAAGLASPEAVAAREAARASARETARGMARAARASVTGRTSRAPAASPDAAASGEAPASGSTPASSGTPAAPATSVSPATPAVAADTPGD